MFSRAVQFARSPQGKKLTEKAMQVAKDPKTKAKLAEARRKLADGKADGGRTK